jgi:RimJ/RimL family protein N-acetyltransferase
MIKNHNLQNLFNLNLRKAILEDKRKTYDWMYRSDITSWHSGKPLFPDQPILSWDEFQLDFLDFYYSQEIDPKGGVWIIEINHIEIGAVCFASFHLNPYCAELDIWLKNSSVCGKGYGVKALREFTQNLHRDLKINYFLIRPSKKNIKAIKAYQKAGFSFPDDVSQCLNFFIHDLYKDQYLAGDYGLDETAVLMKKLI